MSIRVDEPVRVAEDLADLFALAFARPDPAIRDTVARVVDRHRHPVTAVKFSDAARTLNVTVPTVRTWVSKGVLDEASTGRVRCVSAVSVGWTLSVIRRAAERSDNRSKLALVLEALSDRTQLEHARDLAKAADTEPLVTFSPAEVEELRNA